MKYLKTTLTGCVILFCNFPAFGNDINDEAKKQISSSYFLFKEIEGLNFDISSKDKKASLVIKKQVGANNAFLKITGKFDGKDTQFANHDGLSGDVEGSIGATFIIDEEIAIAEKSAILNRGIAAFAPIDNELRNCAKKNDIKVKDTLSMDNVNSKAFKGKCDSQVKGWRKFQEDSQGFNYHYVHGQISYSPSSFGHYDIAQDKTIKESTEGYGVKLALGRYSETAGLESDFYLQSRFEIGVDYREDDKPENSNKKRNICKPLVDNDGYTECFDAYLAPTADIEKTIPYISYAMNFSASQNRWVNGVKLKLTHTTTKTKTISSYKKTKRLGVSLPVTLFVSKDKGYRAGVSVNWQEKLSSDNDDFDKFSLGLFVSAGFDLAGF